MNRVIIALTLQFENRLLQKLLSRFVVRQIAVSSRNSSELVDCATIVLDEVAP